eukprot:scaffold4802_cov96-Skeletonema_dohrnii-CCMP3373.AAC.6
MRAPYEGKPTSSCMQSWRSGEARHQIVTLCSSFLALPSHLPRNVKCHPLESGVCGEFNIISNYYCIHK